MVTKFSWYGPEVMAKLDAQIAGRLNLAAALVEGEAKRSMGTEKTGRLYRKPNTRVMYTASAPGEAPAVRTGALQSSITHDPPFKAFGSWHCHVGTDEPYAPYLELGTSKMLPRPFLRPALDKNREAIRLILAGGFSGIPTS